MASIRWSELREFDVLLVTSLIWFLAQFIRYVFPPLFGTFRDIYGVTNTTIGLLFTSLMLSYAAMQFPSGAFADRLGQVRVIVSGVLVTTVGAWVAFGVRSFPALAVSAILIGLGTGAHKTVAITLLKRVYPKRTGGVLGTMDAIGSLGGAAGPAAVVVVLALGLGWEVVFLLIGIFAVGLAIAFRDRVCRRPSSVIEYGGPEVEAATDGWVGNARAYLAPFRNPHLSAFVVVTITYSIFWNGVTAFLPLFLENETILTQEGAALVYGTVFLVSFVQPLTGTLADRVGRNTVMVGTLGLTGVGLVTLLSTSNAVGAVVAVLMIGIGGNGFRPVRGAYLIEAIPEAVGGGTLGIVRTIMIGVGALAPAIVGYLSEVFGFDVAFGVLTGGVVVAAGIVGVMLVTEGRRLPE